MKQKKEKRLLTVSEVINDRLKKQTVV